MMNSQHDSDCAQHNEPAFPNQTCDCSVKRNSFREACKPLIKWINENGHPHMMAIVDTTNAQLYESQISINTMEFVKG